MENVIYGNENRFNSQFCHFYAVMLKLSHKTSQNVSRLLNREFENLFKRNLEWEDSFR